MTIMSSNHQYESIIELDDGKIYRKALYLMVKTMVYSKTLYLMVKTMVSG